MALAVEGAAEGEDRRGENKRAVLRNEMFALNTAAQDHLRKLALKRKIFLKYGSSPGARSARILIGKGFAGHGVTQASGMRDRASVPEKNSVSDAEALGPIRMPPMKPPAVVEMAKGADQKTDGTSEVSLAAAAAAQAVLNEGGSAMGAAAAAADVVIARGGNMAEAASAAGTAIELAGGTSAEAGAAAGAAAMAAGASPLQAGVLAAAYSAGEKHTTPPPPPPPPPPPTAEKVPPVVEPEEAKNLRQLGPLECRMIANALIREHRQASSRSYTTSHGVPVLHLNKFKGLSPRRSISTARAVARANRSPQVVCYRRRVQRARVSESPQRATMAALHRWQS